MTTANSTIVATIDRERKTVALSAALSLYESRPVTVTHTGGETWPAGDYRLALAYQGRVQVIIQLAWVGGALSGTALLSSISLADLFDLLGNPRYVTLDAELWDNQAKVFWASGRVDVLNAQYTDAAAAPSTPLPDGEYAGTTEIPDGADTVTVDISAYGLTAEPVVVATVAGPGNVFATVSSISATSFVVSLSAAVEGTGYVLNWMVIT